MTIPEDQNWHRVKFDIELDISSHMPAWAITVINADLLSISSPGATFQFKNFCQIKKSIFQAIAFENAKLIYSQTPAHLNDGWRDHDTLVIDPGVTLNGSWVAGLHGTTIPAEEVILAVRAGIIHMITMTS